MLCVHQHVCERDSDRETETKRQKDRQTLWSQAANGTRNALLRGTFTFIVRQKEMTHKKLKEGIDSLIGYTSLLV